MHKTLHSLTPNFLHKIDKQLLLHHPDIWATKIHHVAFWGSIYFLILTSIAWTYPIAMDNVPNVDALFMVLTLPSVVAFIYWVYQLYLFRIEKNFGISNVKARLRTQLIYISAIAFLGICPYYYSSILSYRTSKLVSIQTMKQDLRNLYALATLEQDEYWNLELPYISDEFQNEMEINRSAVTPNENDKEGTIELGLKTFNKYSILKINTSELPLLKKEWLALDMDNSSREKNKLNENISNILKAQYSEDFFGINIFPILWSWLLLVLSLGLFIFLRVEVTTFLMATVTGFVLLGLMGLSIEMSRLGLHLHGRELDKFVFLAYTLLLTTLAVLGFSTRNTRRFAIVRQICLILVTVGIIFEPALVGLSLFPNSPFIRHEETSVLLFVMGIFLAWGMWNLIFSAKMRHLYSNPIQN